MDLTWIEEERKKILARELSPQELSDSLITEVPAKRRLYACGPNFVVPSSIKTWKDQFGSLPKATVVPVNDQAM